MTAAARADALIMILIVVVIALWLHASTLARDNRNLRSAIRCATRDLEDESGQTVRHRPPV